MDFRWVPQETNRKNKQPDYWYLLVGVAEVCVARVERHPKKWSAWIELPGCAEPRPKYADLDTMKLLVEDCVRHWFDLCNTDRPTAIIPLTNREPMRTDSPDTMEATCKSCDVDVREIEITPKMIEAGVEISCLFDATDREDWRVIAIFEAMIRAK